MTLFQCHAVRDITPGLKKWPVALMQSPEKAMSLKEGERVPGSVQVGSIFVLTRKAPLGM